MNKSKKSLYNQVFCAFFLACSFALYLPVAFAEEIDLECENALTVTETVNSVLSKSLNENKKNNNYKDLSTYIQQIRRYKILSREAEVEVFDRIAKGDERARDILVLTNLRFVIYIAHRYEGRGLSLWELIQLGNIGIIKAAERYDVIEKKHLRFITYASYWIRAAITRALPHETQPIYISDNRIELLNSVAKVEKQLRKNSTTHQDPSLSEVVLAMNYEPDSDEFYEMMTEIQHLKNTNTEAVTWLDEPVRQYKQYHSETRIITKLDLLPAPDEFDADAEEFQTQFKKILSQLPEQDRFILECRFGINQPDGKPMPVSPLAKLLKVTPLRVKRIEENAIEQLKKITKRDRNRKFLDLLK